MTTIRKCLSFVFFWCVVAFVSTNLEEEVKISVAGHRHWILFSDWSKAPFCWIRCSSSLSHCLCSYSRQWARHDGAHLWWQHSGGRLANLFEFQDSQSFVVKPYLNTPSIPGLGKKRKEIFFFAISFITILCVWVFCLHVCLCTTCVPGACRKKSLCPLRLELQKVVSHCVGPGNEPGSSGPSASTLNC